MEPPEADDRPSAWDKIPPASVLLFHEALHMDMAAGWLSRICSKLIISPLLQTRYRWQSMLQGSLPNSDPITPWFESTRQAYRSQGPFVLWSGILPSSLVFWPTQMFNLAFKDALKVVFPEQNEGVLGRSLRETAFGLGPQILSYPLHVLEVLVALDDGGENDEHWGFRLLKSPLRLCHLGADLGPRGLFTAMGYKLASGFVESCALNVTVEWISCMAPSHDRLVRALASFGAKLLAYPLMLINVHAIAAKGGMSSSDVHKVVQEDGVIALWRGVWWTTGPDLLLTLLLSYSPTFASALQAITGMTAGLIMPVAAPVMFGVIHVPHALLRWCSNGQ